ncbi:MAG: hypothetical protein R3B09_09580 [Nannocystaceae bacterium]
MDEAIADDDWLPVAVRGPIALFVARSLACHDDQVWATIEVRNRTDAPIDVDLTPAEAPRLVAVGPVVQSWIEPRFDPGLRERLVVLRAQRGRATIRLDPGGRWQFPTEPCDRQDFVRRAREWTVRGRIAAAAGPRGVAFQWSTPELPRLPSLREGGGRREVPAVVEPDPETLAALLYERPEALEPTRAGFSPGASRRELWVWGFARDDARLRPEHLRELDALRGALATLPAERRVVVVQATTSVGSDERWPGCGAEALADARAEAVYTALGFAPGSRARRSVEMVNPVTDREDPTGVARRRSAQLMLFGDIVGVRGR